MMRRRPSPTTPARPVPIKIILVGSGTAEVTTGVIKTEMLPAPTEFGELLTVGAAYVNGPKLYVVLPMTMVGGPEVVALTKLLTSPPMSERATLIEPLTVVEPVPAEVDPLPILWVRLSVKLKAGVPVSVGGATFVVEISMSSILMICVPFSDCETGWPVPIRFEAVPNGIEPPEVVENVKSARALTPAASREQNASAPRSKMRRNVIENLLLSKKAWQANVTDVLAGEDRGTEAAPPIESRVTMNRSNRERIIRFFGHATPLPVMEHVG